MHDALNSTKHLIDTILRGSGIVSHRCHRLFALVKFHGPPRRFHGNVRNLIKESPNLPLEFLKCTYVQQQALHYFKSFIRYIQKMECGKVKCMTFALHRCFETIFSFKCIIGPMLRSFIAGYFYVFITSFTVGYGFSYNFPCNRCWLLLYDKWVVNKCLYISGKQKVIDAKINTEISRVSSFLEKQFTSKVIMQSRYLTSYCKYFVIVSRFTRSCLTSIAIHSKCLWP